MYSEQEMNERGFVAVPAQPGSSGEYNCNGCVFDLARVEDVHCLDAPCSPANMGQHIIWIAKGKDAA